MRIIEAIALGLVQGLTEFLPVSSSAHLVILQHFFAITGPTALVFDIVVHLGTLAAILIYFRKDLFWVPKIGMRFFGLLILATIPTGIMGVLFHHQAEMLFSSLRMVGIALIINSFILWSTRFSKPKKQAKLPKWLQAIAIGAVQGIAIIPGISRSGSTITAGLWCRLEREAAAKFSFFLAIPAILGAAVLEGRHTIALMQGGMWPVLTAGFLSALVSGYFAISILFKIISRGRFHMFAIYTLIVGATVFLFTLFS